MLFSSLLQEYARQPEAVAVSSGHAKAYLALKLSSSFASLPASQEQHGFPWPEVTPALLWKHQHSSGYPMDCLKHFPYVLLPRVVPDMLQYAL